MKPISPFSYAKREIAAGKFPVITIDHGGLSHWLCDGEYRPLKGRHYVTRHSAENARSKVLDRARIAIERAKT